MKNVKDQIILKYYVLNTNILDVATRKFKNI